MWLRLIPRHPDPCRLVLGHRRLLTAPLGQLSRAWGEGLRGSVEWLASLRCWLKGQKDM